MEDREIVLMAAFKFGEVARRLTSLARVARSRRVRQSLEMMSTRLLREEGRLVQLIDEPPAAGATAPHPSRMPGPT